MATASPNHLSLARFAFNIYGSIGGDRSLPRLPEKSRGKTLKYTCDKEITAITRLHAPLNRLNDAASSHVVIGGKNYLKLLALDASATRVVADINLFEPLAPVTRLHAAKLFNVNTMKTQADKVACGLTSGAVHVFQVAPAGRGRLVHRLDDHKRVINSLDFVDQDPLLVLGSQDGTVRLWDLRTFTLKPVVRLLASQHSDPVRLCQTSPHSRVRNKLCILSVHDSGALCKYDLRYPVLSHLSMVLPERRWTFHTGPALSLHIHPDSEHLLTGGRDRKICLWNYAETHATAAPEVTLNTYGPVMKVRWNELPNDDKQNVFSNDFACSFLNDDPLIAVYNISRKYVPKEIITTSSHKPIQNFIWARGGRRIWTITKSNAFVGYDLESPDPSVSITRPQQNLPAHVGAWAPGFASLTLASQDEDDYDLLVTSEPTTDYEEEDFAETASVASMESSSTPAKSVNSMASPPTFFYKKERPLLVRLATQLSYKPRPTLQRDQSLSTIDLTSLSAIMMHAVPAVGLKKPLPASPYVVSLAVPIPLADDEAFAALASEYLTGLPDGFSLSHVCEVNARVAASANRFRDCQTWRLLSTALDFEPAVPTGTPPSMVYQNHEAESLVSGLSLNQSPVNRKVGNMSGELGNLVGSYNLDLTVTTNYGSGPRKSDAASPMRNFMGSLEFAEGFTALHKEAAGKNTGEDTTANQPLAVENSDQLKDTQPNTQAESEPKVENPTPEELMPSAAVPSSSQTSSDAPQPKTAITVPLPSKPQTQLNKGFHVDNTHSLATNSRISPKGTYSSMLSSSYNSNSLVSSGVSSSMASYRGRPSRNLQDIDDENLNILTSASASYSAHAGFEGMRDRSPARSAPFLGFASKRPVPINTSLTKVRSHLTSSITDQKTPQSALTRAMEDASKIGCPWSSKDIVKKAYEYAVAQGDLVMASTLTLLFYEHYPAGSGEMLASEEQCLEGLGLYIDTLRQRMLFCVAAQVVKDAPKPLKYRLADYASKDVEMRFYCCWCQQLLTNEASKERAGSEFGYWYCDECRRRQTNCVYCNEPCKGLSVVESLKCGHRGHYDCFQEWHLEEGEVDCPGGCDH